MPFKKGQKKIGGKQKGTPNKLTKDIKESFKQLIENNLDNMTEWLERIAIDNPAKAMDIINSLSEYIVPKLSRSETDLKHSGSIITGINMVNPNGNQPKTND